jgi:hypothetical protein
MFMIPPAKQPARSSEIAVHDLDQLSGSLGIKRIGISGGIDQMGADVIFDHLHQQAIDRPPAPGNLMHDLRATRLAVERALNGFHLPANAAHPVQKLLLFGNGWFTPGPLRVSFRIGGYPILARKSMRPSQKSLAD